MIKPGYYLNEELRIDWQRVALNLRDVKPIAQIAKEVGMDAGTLQRIARGDTKQPKIGHGVKLLDLHYDLCPDLHDMKMIGY